MWFCIKINGFYPFVYEEKIYGQLRQNTFIICILKLVNKFIFNIFLYIILNV